MVYSGTAGQSLSGYSLKMPKAYAGLETTPSEAGKYLLYLQNAGLQAKQTIGTMTVAGTIGTETFTVTISGVSPLFGLFTEAIAVVAVGGDTATTVAGKLVIAINANERVNDVLVASNVAGVITLTIRREGGNPVTAVTGAATGAATLTAAPTITSFVTAGSIRFGYVAVRYPGYTENECSAMTTNTNVTILGIVKAVNEYEQPYPIDFLNIMAVPPNGTTHILRRGEIWVPVAAAVVAETVPGIVNTTGQFTTSGVGTALTGARYMTAAAAGELAKVGINL